MAHSLAPVSQLPVSDASTLPTAAFSPAAWADLAGRLVGQDRVLMPVGSGVLGHTDSDAPHERTHRQASALALIQHWSSMGFALTKADVLRLCEQDPTVHAWLHKFVTPALKERLGGHVRLEPMYSNFPKEVMDLSEAELLHNALAHYEGDLVDERVLPVSVGQPRKRLKEAGRVRVLRLTDLAGLRDSLGELARMNTVWTPAQVALAQQALPLMLAWGVVGPETTVAQRENQARLTGAWLHLLATGHVHPQWPAARLTVTDVLRAAVAYSGGDPALTSGSPKVRFARLRRPQRRALMHALEQAVGTTATALDDLHRYRQTWLRLAEQLHVGEWQAMPRAQAAVAALRNAPAPTSWHGHLDAALAQPADARVVSAVSTLFKRNPGYGARALRQTLLWANGYEAAILDAFSSVVAQVDTPLLLAVDAAFRAEAPKRDRIMLPKGSPAKRYRVAGRARAVDPHWAKQVVEACERALLQRFSALPPLGRVFVEPGLEQVLLPKGLRTASDSVGVVARGSQLPVGETASVVRLFLWWKDTDSGRVDIDLSAVGLDQDFRTTDTCNYQALREQGLTHSGDLTSAPHGAAEFVDVHLKRLDKATRYVVLTANVFYGPAFSELPECFVGWQERERPRRGELVELKTVAEKFQVTCPTKGFVGAVFDVKARTLMWLDLPLKSRSGFSIHGSMDDIRAAVEDFHLYAASQPTLARLTGLHMQARNGHPVTKREDADTVFCVTPVLAQPGQTVIAAVQPQAVAAALMAGSAEPPNAAFKVLDAPAVDPLVSPVKLRTAAKPRRG